MEKIKVKVITGIVFIFLLGMISGILCTSLFIKYKFKQFAQGGPPFQTELFMKQLTSELKLSDKQQADALKIVNETTEEIHKFMQNSRDDFFKLMQQRDAKLKEILTPEQQNKLDEMYKRIQKSWQMGPLRGGRPPFGPPPSK
jgi:hypothetical protein